MSIFLYACESWTLTRELEKRINSFELRCYRKLLDINYKEHTSNETIRTKITESIGKHKSLLEIVKERKLKWFGHATRSNGLQKFPLQGTMPGKQKRGLPKKKWLDNISEWNGLSMEEATRTAENRSKWRAIVWSSLSAPPTASSLMDVMGEVRGTRYDFLFKLKKKKKIKY